MSDYISESELRHAMEAARAYKAPLEADSTMVKFIGHLEEAIENTFDAAPEAERPALREAEHLFHHRLEILIRTQIRDMKQARPLEEMDEAVERFLRSVDTLRNLLPANAVPSPLTMRDQTRFMLIGMEEGLRHSEEYEDKKIERLKHASAREIRSWDKLLEMVQSDTEGTPGSKPRLKPTDPILDAGRRRAAHVTLCDFKLAPELRSTWFDELQQITDLARSHLRGMGNNRTALFISDHMIALEENLKQFCDAAACDDGQAEGLQNLCDRYQHVANNVETLRNLLPETMQGRIPAAEQFAEHQERVLDRVRKAVASVHPRINRDASGQGRAA